MTVKSKGKWVRRSVGERRAVLTRFAASGLGVAAFCRREGISVGSLQRWRAAHGEAGDGGPHVPGERAPGFVDVGALGTVSPMGQRLEVRLDLGEGVVVHLVRG